MSLKIKDISNMAFELSFKKFVGMELPIRTTWKMKELITDIDKEVKKYNDLRNALLEKHAKKTKDGKTKFKDDKNTLVDLKDVEAFTTEHEELLDIDIEVTPIEIKFDELGKDFKLSTTDMIHLSKIIDFK